MKKQIIDLTVRQTVRVHERYVLLKLTHEEPLPEMLPGQFVEVRVDDVPSTFLRRPISIHFVDKEKNELWLLVAAVGDGSLCDDVPAATDGHGTTARQHGGGRRLCFAVGVDVADGLGVCPRRLRGEQDECEGSDEFVDVVYHNNIMYNV